MGFIISIIVGCVAGYLAGLFTKGKGFGFWLNLVVGVLGGFVGSFVLGLLGINSSNIIGQIIISTVGSVIFLFLVKYISNKMS